MRHLRCACRSVIGALGVCGLALLGGKLSAQAPAEGRRPGSQEVDPSGARADQAHPPQGPRNAEKRWPMPEAVEMFLAIARGSKMGPGQGWFHPGQSRYDWKWLAEHFDTNRDGKIDRKEFPGPRDWFRRLDRDQDGVLTPADFDWSENSPRARQEAVLDSWFSGLDANSNGRISRAEWDAFFAKASRGRGYLTPEDLHAALKPTREARQKRASTNRPSPWVLLKGLLGGELGSLAEGPRVGQPAPDFALKTFDRKRTIRLADYRGKDPLVLVFGSFT